MQDARQQGPEVFDGESANAVAFFRAIDAHIDRRAAFSEALEEAARPPGHRPANSAVAAPRQRAPRAARSLWLDIVTREESYLFELSARNERAVVVGSFQQADVRIRDARVEPVELHFERDGDAVCVVPAYGSTIEVNAVRLCRPRRIVDRAIVEFQGHVLRVRVLDEPGWCPEATPCDAPTGRDDSSGLMTSAATKDSEITLTRIAPAAPAALPPTALPETAPATGPSAPSTVVATVRAPRLASPSAPSARVVTLAIVLALWIGFLCGRLSHLLMQ